MLNLDFIAEDFDGRVVLCEDVTQARALWDAVKEKWPDMVRNWESAGPPRNPKDFQHRVFIFDKYYSGGRRLVHGSPGYYEHLTIIPFNDLCVDDLPEFEADVDLSLLFG